MMFNIRRMQYKDICQVYNIECTLFSDPWSRNSFIVDIQNNDHSYPFVLEKNNKIIGYVICWYYLNELHIGNFANDE